MPLNPATMRALLEKDDEAELLKVVAAIVRLRPSSDPVSLADTLSWFFCARYAGRSRSFVYSFPVLCGVTTHFWTPDAAAQHLVFNHLV